MFRSARLAGGLAAVALALALTPPVLAHQPGDTEGPYPYGEAPVPAASGAMRAIPPATFENGRCTKAAREGMPAADAHDHADSTQHAFSCAVRQVFYDDLKDELAARPDAVLAEMDVKAGLMAVTVSYPESGFLLFDVADASRPRFLSWYRSNQCEGLLWDVDCGAYVDIAPDGKTVYLSKQAYTTVARLPVPDGTAGMRPPEQRGIEVVDIADRTAPRLRQFVPVGSTVGVHTARSFDVPATGGAGPREPGRYVAAIEQDLGVRLYRDVAGLLVPVSSIPLAGAHDTSIEQDELTGRTFLYTAMGFGGGFDVQDVTAPTAPVGLAEWDLTPECFSDWFSHTVDVTTVRGRRIVTMPAETFAGGAASAEQQALGCGATSGNPDLAGPLWIVDATDLKALGRSAGGIPFTGPQARQADLKQRSEAALITTWSNAAGRAGGTYVFTPHNQQVVGDRIYVSQYHGGVVALDASEAFAGRNVRPKEVALASPSEPSVRPQPLSLNVPGVFTSVMSETSDYRPWAWDATFLDGHLLIPDGGGGISSWAVAGD